MHVLAVATGQWPLHNRIWLIEKVREAMAAGDQFYIQNRETLETFRLCCKICPVCQITETLDTEDPNSSVKIQDLPLLH